QKIWHWFSPIPESVVPKFYGEFYYAWKFFRQRFFDTPSNIGSVKYLFLSFCFDVYLVIYQ
ncbi:MAG: hypothetical protein Q3959_02890, partial [Limosilactobacillus sp.]|uniref:hypothetical protein n=1 Tax=Limosilactobacillus sp. TaxID=2773925 RepID=UPI0026FAA41F|nr:hypothetical protein [Limosilactobacillus sp.]